MTRAEIRGLLNSYERATEEDGRHLMRPGTRERQLMGEAMLHRRLEAVQTARDANRQFMEAFIQDIPDLYNGLGDVSPARTVALFADIPDKIATLPSSSYGSMASAFLHLFRDWSDPCQHVIKSTYEPA